MNEDINIYTVKLKKIERVIDITIINNNHKSMADFCYALFEPHINKYYLFGIPTKLSIEILLHHNIIEQMNKELPPAFVLTNCALISLL